MSYLLLQRNKSSTTRWTLTTNLTRTIILKT